MALPAPILLSSIGMADSLILMILALVVFGPRKLPQIGRQVGKLMYEFRKASNDFKFQMEEELRLAEDADRRKQEEAARQKMLADQAAVHAQPALAASAESADDPYKDVYNDPTAVSAADATAQSVPEPHVPRVAEPVGPGAVNTGQVSSGPVIQPPSTGETVAAASPAASVNGSAVAEAAASAEAVVAEPAAEATSSSSTETVTQHG